MIADPTAKYFGTELSERSIAPDDEAELGETRFADWLRVEAGAAAVAKTISQIA